MTAKGVVWGIGVVALAVGLVLGCRTERAGQPCNVVEIELEVLDTFIRTRERIDYWQHYLRVRAAGPQAVPQLAIALESKREGHRYFAYRMLKHLVELEWPEVYRFVTVRLRRLPKSHEAGSLLSVLGRAGAKRYPEIAPLAAHYLDDRSLHLHRGAWSSGRHKLRSYRVCDLAALVLQHISGESFDKGGTLHGDEVVDAAKGWWRANRHRFPRQSGAKK